LIQKGTVDQLRGRAFTVLMGSTTVTMALGLILAGRMTDLVAARWVLAERRICPRLRGRRRRHARRQGAELLPA
jgi:hypothetical protein